MFEDLANTSKLPSLPECHNFPRCLKFGTGSTKKFCECGNGILIMFYFLFLKYLFTISSFPTFSLPNSITSFIIFPESANEVVALKHENVEEIGNVASSFRSASNKLGDLGQVIYPL